MARILWNLLLVFTISSFRRISALPRGESVFSFLKENFIYVNFNCFLAEKQLCFGRDPCLFGGIYARKYISAYNILIISYARPIIVNIKYKFYELFLKYFCAQYEYREIAVFFTFMRPLFPFFALLNIHYMLGHSFRPLLCEFYRFFSLKSICIFYSCVFSVKRFVCVFILLIPHFPHKKSPEKRIFRGKIYRE